MAGAPYADMPCSMAVTDAAWEHIDPTPNIHELFVLTGFTQVFAIHATTEDAHRAFGQGRA